VTVKPLSVTVVGAGIIGLWQALTLARAGHQVHLIEASSEANPFAASASRYAGAMLSPDCEAESAPLLVRDLGRVSLPIWRSVYPGLLSKGSLVVPMPRDPRDLARYAKLTEGHTLLDAAKIAELEPELAERFDAALYFANEAHMSALDALTFLLRAVGEAGVRVSFAVDGMSAVPPSGVVIDCRGRAAADRLAGLRGVRGERIVVRARDVHLQRPVRLLHPRVPFYVVPWPGQLYLVGTTVIETDESGPMTVRSAIELLGAACMLHPGFAEGEILELDAGVRPALPDNVPRAMVEADGRTIRVNGAYRHGFLLAPILAQAVCDYLEGGKTDSPLLMRM
jgi:glycine oxidase